MCNEMNYPLATLSNNRRYKLKQILEANSDVTFRKYYSHKEKNIGL